LFYFLKTKISLIFLSKKLNLQQDLIKKKTAESFLLGSQKWFLGRGGGREGRGRGDAAKIGKGTADVSKHFL